MEWISAIRKSVEYIEEHLKEKIVAQDVANQLYMSQVHFQKGFLVMTGYSVAEYIRNRRLYMAALEQKDSDKKVIDVALQSINTRIFKEWLPGNPNYEISGNANVEWYDCMNGEKTDPDYHSAVWIPVKRK